MYTGVHAVKIHWGHRRYYELATVTLVSLIPKDNQIFLPDSPCRDRAHDLQRVLLIQELVNNLSVGATRITHEGFYWTSSVMSLVSHWDAVETICASLANFRQRK